jgi:hypothetical protein
MTVSDRFVSIFHRIWERKDVGRPERRILTGNGEAEGS